MCTDCDRARIHQSSSWLNKNTGECRLHYWGNSRRQCEVGVLLVQADTLVQLARKVHIKQHTEQLIQPVVQPFFSVLKNIYLLVNIINTN